MIHRILIALALLLVAGPAFAQTAGKMNDEEYLKQEGEVYSKCIANAKQDPKAALKTALTWRDTGGGLPARHCVAVAYTNLGQYLNAALEFETLADEMRRGVGWPFENPPSPDKAGLLPEVYAQGGNAWMLAGDPVKAYEFFTLGLAEATPDTKDYINLLIDRSLASAGMGEYQKALDDLSEVEGKIKPNAQIYVLKASALRELQHYDQARVEIDKAFALDSENREGFLEKGNLLRETGDNEGARQNWLAYLRLYPDGPAADQIRENLEKMDVKTDNGN